MPYDGSGAYALPAGSTAVTGATILASVHNTPIEDIAAALSQVVLRSGVAAMSGDLNMNGNKVEGLAAADTNGDAVRYEQAGLLAAANAFSVAGTQRFTNTTDGSNIQVARFDGDRATPTDGDIASLGLFLSDDGGTQTEMARLSWQAVDVSDTEEDGAFIFAVRTAGALNSELFLDGTTLRPWANDGLALGTVAASFSDLFLASGGVVNWNNGDVTVTHSSNTLTFAGASSGYSFDAALSIGTSAALTAGSVELGHASDTTLSRAAAGRLAVEGVTIEPGAARAMFRARKTSDQAISATTTTDVSWVETTDNGGLFTTPTWTPPAGYIHVEAVLSVFNTSGSPAQVEVVIYKNNSASSPSQGSVTIIPNGGSAGCYASLIDQANGTDTYRVKIRSTEAVTIVDNGGVLTNDCSYFHGTMI